MTYQELLDNYRESEAQGQKPIGPTFKRPRKMPETSVAFASEIPSRTFTKGSGGDLTSALRHGRRRP